MTTQEFSVNNEIGIGEHELHVWYADLDPVPQKLDILNGLLSPDESKRAKKFRFWRDQRRYTAGRGILRLLIGRYLLVDPKEIEIRYNDFGKPFLRSRALKFNLAHCRDMVIYAFCIFADVGVDLECIRPIEDASGLAARFFSPNENEAFLSTPVERKTEIFLTYWTLKEAYIKAIGQGLSYPLDQFEIRLSNDTNPQIRTSQDDSEDGSNWSLFSISPESECVAAVAVRGNGWHLIDRKFEM